MEAITDDVWTLVAEQMYNDGDMKTLQAMCLVSSGFSRIGIPWLYRYLVLDMNEQELTDLVNNILSKDVGRYIHAISITRNAEASFEYLISEIFRLLPALSVLQDFSWRYLDQVHTFVGSDSDRSIRQSELGNSSNQSDPERLMMLLEGMTSLSKLELGYMVDVFSEHHLIPPSFRQISFLESLDLHIDTGGFKNLEPCVSAQCKALIAAATNLRTLKLTSEISTQNQLIPTALYFNEDDHIPPIKTLILDKYGVGCNHVGQLRPPLQELEHRLQVSALRTLSMRTGGWECVEGFLETLMDRGPICLKTFEISVTPEAFDGDLDSVLSGFLLHFKGLERLRCGGDGEFVPCFGGIQAAIANHSETLLFLSLIEQERGFICEPYKGISLKELRLISVTCPRLEELEIDLASPDGIDILKTNWPRDWDLPSLRTLKIYTSVTHADNDTFLFDYVQRLVTRLGYLCTHLRRLTVTISDFIYVRKRSDWDVRYTNMNGKNTPTIIEEHPHENSVEQWLL